MNSFVSPSDGDTSAQRAELARLVEGAVSGDGMHPTAIEPLHLIRCAKPGEMTYGLHKPALCVIVQGGKEVRLADELYRYDPLHYLVCLLYTSPSPRD